MPETKYEIDFSQEADETLVRLICIEEIQNDLLKEVIKRYIKIIKEKLEKPKLTQENISDKLLQLRNSLSEDQINVESGDLYTIMAIRFNSDKQDFDIIFTRAYDTISKHRKMPYKEFIEKFRPWTRR